MSCLRLGAVGGVLRIAALAVVLLSCVSCAHLEAVPSTDADAQQLIGHDIRVTTMDGQILEFRLAEVTESALTGKFEQVRFEDIALLERRDSNILNTAWFWVGAGAATMLLAVVLFAYGLSQSI